MITLATAQVWKYKSIEDSSSVDIDPAVTVLVGKNESGKTAFLEALCKALSSGKADFKFVFDYPRKDYVRYRPQHDAKQYARVVNLIFRIEKELADKINADLFHGTQVIKPEQTFTRTTNYGNGSSIGLEIDQLAAIAALRKPLEGIENTDEAFADAHKFDDVVAKIEALKLPDENRLSVLAKTWRDRFAKAASGWDIIGWHIWKAYLDPNLPRFLYFDDYKLLEGKINLESLSQRRDADQLSEADETVFGLFDLAGIDLNPIYS